MDRIEAMWVIAAMGKSDERNGVAMLNPKNGCGCGDALAAYDIVMNAVCRKREVREAVKVLGMRAVRRGARGGVKKSDALEERTLHRIGGELI
jgi:pentatricopeptide repeat protein